MPRSDTRYLDPTAIIDSDNAALGQYAATVLDGVASDPVAQAVQLYYAVRDDIWYDPYYPFYKPEHYQASRVLQDRRGYCVSKASLLCALGRSCGIPTRVGFATVRNHLATRELIEYLGSDLFVYHGYTEFHLEGKWVKATPAFNRELCQRHAVTPLAFNGREDSLFHAFNTKRELFMEYVAEHGTYADIPVAQIVEAWQEAYGAPRVAQWIAQMEAGGGRLERDFYREAVISGTDPDVGSD
jgi:transglutaminase-like putative cysteine protease